jgi:type I restriction enzyme S subunit
MVSPAYVVARPKSGLLTSIIEQQLRTPNAVEEMRRYSQGVTDFRLRLYWEEFKCISVVIPPTAEQREIAEFLEGETRKINGLVSEQRRLMELLREKRQAVISHAVTRGLNPAAPLKPSGIEWLGDVPTHWEVKRIKFVTAGVKAGPFGSALTKDVYVSAGFRVYGQEQVIPNDFTLGDYFITPEKYEELSQYSVSPGDILISCVGTFGKIAIVPGEIVPGIINPRLIRLRCSKAIKAEYLVEVMRSNVTFEQLSSFTRGGTMDVINIGTLSGIFLALPPMPEQEELLTFMSQESSKFDALKAEAQRAIDLLLERRTALISAAVTGQIDVCAMAN